MIKAGAALWEKSSDWLVWLAGGVCFILLFSQSLFNQNITDDKNSIKYSAATNLDDLLLSSKEMVFADKKSFVNNALRYDLAKDSALSTEYSRGNLYNYIYQKKIAKTGKKTADKSGFSIKPVPQ